MSNLLRIKRRHVFESTPHVENEVDELDTGVCAQIVCTQAISNESGSSISNKLRTFNGKIDPVDGEAILGNVMGIPASAWPLGITPEDYRIHTERPEPVVLQERLVLQEHYQLRMFAQRLRKQQQLEQDFNEVVHQ
ncbi:hypothetical protein Tco_0576676 [Tanacetum coccineum]